MNAITPEIEDRVRDRAYAMWENEGRPAGRDVDHWLLSVEATLAELSPVAIVAKAAKAPARKKPAAPKRAAAAALSATTH